MKKVELHWQILIALVFSVFFGVYLRDYVGYISWMGDIFMRALKMIIIPLVVSSMISGVANIGSAESLGRLGLKTMLFYVGTGLLAILTGLALVNLIKPGIGADLQLVQDVSQKFGNESLGDILLRIIPENIFLAFTINNQLLSVILFSILFGFFITQAPTRSALVLSEFFNAVFEVMMKLTMFIIRFTPFGIFGLVAAKVAEQNDLVALFQSMGIYMLVVLAGLTLHGFVTMPLIIKFIGKINPIRHMRAMRAPLLTAFSTSSSNATLPLTMEAVENEAGVSAKIASFTLPLGATINMNGTALYECVAVMFIAQAYGIELNFMQQAVVVVTALLASIGAAGIPMAGLVMISIVLTAVGLPLEGVGLILAVDRLLDMFRTTINVWGDTCAAVVIAKSEGETLKV